MTISGPWLWSVVLLKETKKQWEPSRSFLRYPALPSEQWLNTTKIKTLLAGVSVAMKKHCDQNQLGMREFISSSREVRWGLMQRPWRALQVSKTCSSWLSQPVFLYNSGPPVGWAHPHPSLIREVPCRLAYRPSDGGVFSVKILPNYSSSWQVDKKLTITNTIFKICKKKKY